MRELKFRAWLDFGEEKYYKYSDSERLSDFWEYYDGENFEQYTGLKDKNGKEIYEGDIVLLTDCAQEVAGVMCCLKTDIRWDEEYYGFILGCTKMGNKLLLCSRNDYIVIGNIHESPELLEAE